MNDIAAAPSTKPHWSDRHFMIPLLALGFSSLCAALMQSLVIPIQSELPSLLHTSAANTGWVVTATLLGGAVAMPVSGRLADIIGKKPVLVASAVILVLGSLLCAITNSFGLVLAGRALQGVAMGYIPVAISMVREVAPPKLVNQAIAGISATLGVGGALGLPLAAWIAQDFNWHVLFWVSAGLALVVTALTIVVLPNPHDAQPARIDLGGAIGLAIGLLAVLIGITKGNDWGWGSGQTWAAIIGGLVVLGLWGYYELRHDAPLVDLRTTAKLPVLLTNLAALLVGFGMMAQAIVSPQLLEMSKATGYGLGQTILDAGLLMAPGGLVMMLFAPISGRLLTSHGGRITLALGAAVIAVGYALAIFMTGAPWTLVIANCIASAGVGIGYAAMPSLILSNVPRSEAASSVGVNSLMRSVGTTISSAVMATVLTSDTFSLGHTAVPTHGAFKLCFLIGAAGAAAAAGITLMIPRDRRRQQQSTTDSPLALRPEAVQD